jgi:hypothetical protein
VLDLSKVMTRLSTEVPALARVAGIAALESLPNAVTALPAAYLMPGAERPDGAEEPNVARQVIRERLTVVLAVRNVADARGEAAADDLRSLSNDIRLALVGWRPDTGKTPLVFEGADPLGYDDQLLLWAEHFSARGRVIAS